MPKAQVDKEKCVGCGLCASSCPGVFEMLSDGKAECVAEDCKECNCQEVARNCPVGAITAEE